MAERVGSVGQRMIRFVDLRDESVVVTHVENPEKFYCRLASNESLFTELNELVWVIVRSPFAARPALSDLQPSHHVLAYSQIHQKWCRSRVIEVLRRNGRQSSGEDKANGDRTEAPINVKLDLIDFGGVEVVSFEHIRLTTDEIIEFNHRQSFCFECRLCFVKPFSESNEWSTYANYLIEKLTKDKVITLKYQKFSDGVVVCDLSSFSPTTNGYKESFHSMIDYLVHMRVARYRVGQDFYHKLFPDDGPDYDYDNPNPEDFEWTEDLVHIDVTDKNKLYFN